MKYKDYYKVNNQNFNYMNRAAFDELREENEGNEEANKYLIMTEEELIKAGFYKKFKHLINN